MFIKISLLKNKLPGLFLMLSSKNEK